MHIRRISHSDIPEILTVAKRCYDEMDFDQWGYRYDPPQIEQSWLMGVEGTRLRGYCEDNIRGLFLLSITDTTAYFKNGPKIAQEIVFHADPTLGMVTKIKIMKNILQYVMEDLAIIGVKSLYVSSDDRFGAISRLIQQQGGKPMSVQHHMEV